ncbi:MAG: AAA-like domain-containing protein [Pseudomonadota bacterium]
MSTRKLRPATIIPTGMYVSRKADRQLDEIVSDMGRPGYVLVARQMGKTNMLIHMKRCREKLGDVVAYVDLSNRHDSAVSLFRYVIDTIVDTDNVRFAEVRHVINEERESVVRSASVEYDRHMRMLLESADGAKIVVILDEVDSLINSSYSDTVLAQVRSMYFSRATYELYENLTYVLSGVAEPSDLIKDKTISPFNIGEKIYLDDFSEEEVGKLFSKAGLDVEREVQGRVYHWTRGNPRMTWDVASAIEKRVAGGVVVSASDVDEIVGHLFLEAFDRAPIDHIRTLAESDASIREGIVALRYGKADTLNEKLLSRLYLAGITKAGSNVALKNPIIDAALSDDWLEKAAGSQKSLLETASERYFAQDFGGALRIFSHWEQTADGAVLPVSHLAERGVCRFQTGDFQGAVDDLQLAREGLAESDLSDSLIAYLGGALLRLDRADETVKLFEGATPARSADIRLSSWVTLSSAYLTVDAEAHASKIIEMFSGDVLDLDAGLQASGTWISATYNLARAYISKRDNKTALSWIKRALERAPVNYHPALNIFAAGITKSHAERIRLAVAASDAIVSNVLVPGGSAHGLEFSRGHIAPILSELISVRQSEAFSRLFEYAGAIPDAPDGPLAIAMWLYESASELAGAGSLIPLVGWAIDTHLTEETPNSLRFSALRANIGSRNRRGLGASENLFAREFQKRAGDDDITEDNVLALLSYTANLVQDGQSRQVIDYLEIIRTRMDAVEQMSPILGVILNQQLLITNKTVEDLDAADTAARRLIRHVDRVFAEDADPPFKSVISNQKAFAERHLASRLAPAPSRPSRTDVGRPWSGLGRNELVVVRYPDSPLEFSRKFKFVERDLRSGVLEWIRKAS